MKLKIPDLKLKIGPDFWKTILLASATAIIISTFFIAMPLSEKLFPGIRYDLKLKSNTWKKTFVLDAGASYEDAKETATIIGSRLNKYQVEEYEIEVYTKRETFDESMNQQIPSDVIDLGADSDKTDSEETNGVRESVEPQDNSDNSVENQVAPESEKSQDNSDNSDSQTDNELNDATDIDDATDTDIDDAADTGNALDTADADNTPDTDDPSEIPSEQDYTTTNIIEVTVQTTKDEYMIQMLIMSTNKIKIMTVKDGVTFDDPNNPFAKNLEENYQESGFDNSSFRYIAVKQLTNSQGDPYYFTIFKPIPGPTAKEFRDFMASTIGQEIGVSIDGFVKPYANYMGEQDGILLPLTTDPEEARFYRLLFNSESFPTSIQVKDIVEKEPLVMKIDYVKTTLAFIVGAVTVALMIYVFTKHQNQKLTKAFSFLLSTGFTTALAISFFKITRNEIDLFNLAIGGLLSSILSVGMVFTKIGVTDVKKSSKQGSRLLFVLTSIGIIVLTFRYLGNGYLHQFSRSTSLVVIGTYIISNLSWIYFTNLKTYFKK